MQKTNDQAVASLNITGRTTFHSFDLILFLTHVTDLFSFPLCRFFCLYLKKQVHYKSSLYLVQKRKLNLDL